MAVHIYDRFGNPISYEQLSAQRDLAKALGSEADEDSHGISDVRHQAMMDEAHRHGMGPVIKQANRDHAPAWDRVVPDSTAHAPNRGSIVRAPFSKRGQYLNTNLTGASFGSGNSASLFTAQTPFLPEWSHPANHNFPTQRRQANAYWRLFYKMDPLIAAVIDMLASLPWSDVQFTGEGVDGEIREVMEYSWSKTKMLSKLPELTKEWHVTGEAIAHLHFDDSQGAFTYLAVHNPDNINVVYSPFIDMDPILEFVPDEKLRHIAISTHPALAKVRESMPPDLVSMLRANQNIPLHPSNVTFIARKQHDYDLRGTSILARLWQLYYSEYPMWAAFAATARRGATPMKVALLGDPATHQYATPAEERRFKELVAQLESDPQGWLVWNGQAKFDMVGNADRLMSINTHYDLFERMKLTAMGVSKAFIAGESSYQSAAAGLTIFMQRLLALRNMFVNEWILPKFFLPLAKANDWRKPDKASKGQFKFKRASADPAYGYIMPELKWAKALDSQADKDLLDVMGVLEERLGVRISDQKKFACIGLDAAEEYKIVVEETKKKRDLAGNDPALMAALKMGGGEPGVGGGGPSLSGPGMSALPGIPGEEFGVPGDGGADVGAPPMVDTPPAGEETAPMVPEGASLKADEGAAPQTPKHKTQQHKTQHDVGNPWGALADLKAFLHSFDPADLEEDSMWMQALSNKQVRQAVAEQNKALTVEALKSWLVDELNYGQETLDSFDAALAPKRLARISSKRAPLRVGRKTPKAL